MLRGRSWIGWHHHATLVMLAHAFLSLEMLRSKKLLGGPCHRRVVRFNIYSSPGQASVPTAGRKQKAHAVHNYLT